MKKFNWQFFGICIVFAAQVMALPYLGKMSFLKPAERSIATNMSLQITNQDEAIVALETAKGILVQVQKDKEEILKPDLDSNEVAEKLQRFNNAEILLAEYENALVHHLTQHRDQGNQSFEQEVFQLSSNISALKSHEVKAVLINRNL
jgi:hypothetical protein